MALALGGVVWAEGVDTQGWATGTARGQGSGSPLGPKGEPTAAAYGSCSVAAKKES